jgi:hypothetical protein
MHIVHALLLYVGGGEPVLLRGPGQSSSDGKKRDAYTR